MDKIRKLSQVCGIAIIAWMITLPVYEVLSWFFYDFSQFIGKKHLIEQHAVSGHIDLRTQLWAICVSMIPVAVALLGLNWLRKLFGLYKVGRVFTCDAIHCIKKVAYYYFIGVIVNIFYGSAISVILSLNNPVGERHLNVGLGAGDLYSILIGLILLLVAYVMDEARKLTDEQALTV